MSSLQTILRIQSRHLLFIFVFLYSHHFFRPFYGYKVSTSSSSPCLCIRIVFWDHPQATDTKYALSLHLRLSVSVSSLQTIIRIQSGRVLFFFVSLYSCRLALQTILRIQSRYLLLYFCFVSLYPYRLFKPFCVFKVGISSSSSCICIRIVFLDYYTDTK